MNTKKSIAIVLLAGAGAVALSISSARVRTAVLEPRANAAAQPRVIEIKARKFVFSPNEIVLKKGEPVILRLSTADRTHGFLLKPYRIDTDIVAGKVTDIALEPTSSGHYLVICDHYCGTGHGNMKLKLDVVD